jgi:hypothetical protein
MVEKCGWCVGMYVYIDRWIVQQRKLRPLQHSSTDQSAAPRRLFSPRQPTISASVSVFISVSIPTLSSNITQLKSHPISSSYHLFVHVVLRIVSFPRGQKKARQRTCLPESILAFLGALLRTKGGGGDRFVCFADWAFGNCRWNY